MEFSIREVVTGGDRDQQTQLDRLDTIGIFTKELEEALLDRRIDVAVHSLKDVPTLAPEELCLAAVTERLDPRDVLVSRGELLAELLPGARIGTGSLRRSIQLSRCRPDLKVQGIRGNVDTRLRKVARGEIEGVIVAAAAMMRLNWPDKITQHLPTEDFLPSPGQGALALEVRRDDEEMLELVDKVNHIATWQSITAERAFLSALGGGCRAPIAALAAVREGRLKIAGMAASPDGTRILQSSAESEASAAGPVGEQLAQELLALGAAQFIAEATGR
jgi:hydroxymethylbilane synthase